MSETDPLSEQSRPRRRWKRWVFGLLILVAIFLVWANGPGIRWATEKILISQLDQQGLFGSFQVHGTALDGLSITHLSLTGSSKIQSVQSDRIDIDWSFDSLKQKEIEAISIEKLHLVIDPEALAISSDEEELSEEEALKALRESLELARGFLKPTTLELTDLKAVIKDTSTVTLNSFTHTPDSDDYLINDLRTLDHLDRPIHNPASTLTWTEDNFAIDRLDLLSKCGLRDLNYKLGETISSQILVGESEITLTTDLKNSHQLVLDSPTLDIADLVQLGKPTLNVGGTITDLQIDTATGLINLQGKNLRYEDQEIASASLQAHTPDLLSPYQQPVHLRATLDDKLDLAGTVILSEEDPLDSQADLAFTLRYPEIPIITGELSYDSREARIRAQALDGLSVNARYFLDNESYEAQATSDLKDASLIHETLTGPLKFTLKGTGSIADETHTGSLQLTEIKSSSPELADTQTQASINYDWPRQVTIEELKITKPEGQVQAKLKWEDDRLTISKLDLIENGNKLFTATANLPAPLDAESLDDIINATAPISLVIKSQPLSFKTLSSFAPIPEELSGTLTANLELSGSLAEPDFNGLATLNTFRTTDQPDIAPIDLELKFETENQELSFNAKAADTSGPLLLNIDGKVPFLPRQWIEDQTIPLDSPIALRVYSPNLELRRLEAFGAKDLSGSLQTDFTISGSIAKPSIKGSTNLNNFRLATQPNLPLLDFNLELETLGQQLLLNARSSEPLGPILSIEGSLPFRPDLWLENKRIPDESPVDLHIYSPRIDLSRFPFANSADPTSPPITLSGSFQTDFTLSGSFAKPKLEGFGEIKGSGITSQPDLPPLDLDLKLETVDQQLLLTARATEPSGSLFDIDGKIPFLPHAWIERKTTPNDSPLDIRIKSPTLDLRRIKPFVPMIKTIDGTIEVDVVIIGNISSPQVIGLAKTRIAKMRIIDSPISTFSNANFDTSFSGGIITIQSQNISASGGSALISGTIDISGPEPLLDIHLDGEHMLLHRTPEYTFRGHTNIDLRGPYTTAAITGSVNVVESLFYKDIEILPFGVPTTTEIPEPKLPTFTTKIKTTAQLEEESFLDNWTLDLDISTGDPVLIRGNLARGEMSGTIKVTGTIDDPKTAGTLTTTDFSADLPFSDLQVQTCIVTLRNEDITNPTLNIRGTSAIGQYTVQVYVTGSVQDPTLILTSDPPLPESEIMILLATGSAVAQLQDRQVASQKALQYLLEGLRRRNRGRDKTVLQRLLKNSDQIELSLGDTNQFSGRQFSSATLELGDRWDFTTQIDELGQTRALVVFSIRLR